MGDYQFIFCESWCPSRVCFESTFIYHGNECSATPGCNWLMELLYADDLVLCGESLNEIRDKYGRWKNEVEEKGLRVNVNKPKGVQLLFRKRSVF